MRKITYDAVLHRKRQLDIDQSDVLITGGSISGVTINEHMDSATDPALNAAVSTAIVDEYNGILITLTGAGNNQTLQDPTTVANVKAFTVANNDTSTNNVVAIAGGVSFTITAGEAQSFIWDGSAWGPMDMGITDIPVKVIQGGTGLATLTDHGILLGSGTDNVTPLAEASNGQLPIGSTGADPTLATITPGDGIDVTNAAGSITVDADLKANGGIVVESTELAVDLGASSITGTLAVLDGGTGATTTGGAKTNLGFMTDVVDDTTPQLGGDLDGQGKYSLDNQSITNLASNGAGYHFNGTSDYQTLSNTINTGANFAISAWVKSNDLSTYNTIFSDASGSAYDAFRFTSTHLDLRVNGVTSKYAYSFANDKLYHICVTKNDSNSYFYINGNYIGMQDILGSADNVSLSIIGKRSMDDLYMKGFIGGLRIENYTMSATEVKDLYSNANIPFKYEGASNTNLVPTASSTFDTDGTAWYDHLDRLTSAWTSADSTMQLTGTATGNNTLFGHDDLLTIGKRYSVKYDIKSSIAGGGVTIHAGSMKDLDVVSMTVDTTWQTFTGTGTAVSADFIVYTATASNVVGRTFDIDNVSVTQIGNAADYNPSGVGHNQWLDASGNENHGVVSGALPTNLEVNHIEKVIKNTITGDTLWTDIVPAGYVIEKIIFEETAGAAAVLSLGTTDTGNDVFTGVTIAASTFTVLDNADLLKSMFSSTAAQTLDLNDDTAGDGWNAASVNVTFLMKRII